MSADRRLILAALLAAASAGADAQSLDPLYSDRAVLQRDRPIRITGSAAPGEPVRVSLAGRSAEARAGPSGRWRVELPPLAAGGPHRLEARFQKGALAAAEDVLVGDVWLCSGQSNMEFPVRRSLNGDAETQAANDAQIRVMTIAQKTSLEPRSAFEENPSWQLLIPDSAADFSAACYFMARDLRRSQKVPFGLIDSAWGGTRIRPWMDEPAARASGGSEDAELLALYRRDPVGAARRFSEQWGAWWRQRTGDTPGREPWNASSRLDWRPFRSVGPWEQWGDPAFANFNGYVWARRRFTLSAAEAATAATLSLGVVDDLDQTWVNGVGVGSSFGWSNPREYRVAPGLLRAGENEIIVNIGDSWGLGGLQGPAERLKLTFADGQVKPIGSGWEYSVVSSDVGGPPRAPWDTHAGLGTIYNAMIAPLGPVSLRGVAWYQGESDVGVSGYDRRLAALMASWRRQFGTPDLPFLVVGLAGFGKVATQPTASGWAELQDEQRQAATGDARAAFVPALDVGERDDIHPPNKQEVARRLALAARSLVYREPKGKLAPLPLAARRTASGVEVRFTGPIRTLSGSRPLAFELCGATQDSCRYADAQVAGSSVVLTGPAGTRVRYAWSDYAIVNLYSGDLPVPTFELPIE